ncbi:MAG: hypothetical protein ACFBSC_06650 [Microcoleaceae cyanobacterium]
MQETVTEGVTKPMASHPPSPEPPDQADVIQQNWFIRVIREPLIHFLLLGALLFGLYFWVNGSSINVSSNRLGNPAISDQIDISAGVIDLLRNNWRRQWGKNPSPEDLQDAVDQYLREEVLYREALKLGMDQNDLIIRRRLVQKMEFLAEDVDTLQEPTDEQLQPYLEAHAERYAIPSRFSFSQIYFSRELRGRQADTDAEQVLKQLQANPRNVQRGLGDRNMLPNQYTLQSPQEVAGLLVQTFLKICLKCPQLVGQGRSIRFTEPI